MGRIFFDPQMIGSIAETIYKEYSFQRGFAITSMESIYNDNTKEGIKFKMGWQRYEICIPHELRKELEQIKPTVKDGTEAFVVDFLSCKIQDSEIKQQTIFNKKTCDFSWVEVKANHSELTKNQIDFARNTKIKFIVARVYDIPNWKYVKIRFEELRF